MVCRNIFHPIKELESLMYYVPKSFLDTLNDQKPVIGYTKIEDLCINFEYKIIGCKIKKTTYGTKIAIYLTGKDDEPLWIFLPKSYVNKFSTKTPFKKLKENGITHLVYKGKEMTRYSTPFLQFISKE